MSKKTNKIKVNIELIENPEIINKLSRLYDLLLAAPLDVGPTDEDENQLCTPSGSGYKIA